MQMIQMLGEDFWRMIECERITKDSDLGELVGALHWEDSPIASLNLNFKYGDLVFDEFIEKLWIYKYPFQWIEFDEDGKTATYNVFNPEISEAAYTVPVSEQLIPYLYNCSFHSKRYDQDSWFVNEIQTIFNQRIQNYPSLMEIYEQRHAQ